MYGISELLLLLCIRSDDVASTVIGLDSSIPQLRPGIPHHNLRFRNLVEGPQLYQIFRNFTKFREKSPIHFHSKKGSCKISRLAISNLFTEMMVLILFDQ
jgi:hypothetical protein